MELTSIIYATGANFGMLQLTQCHMYLSVNPGSDPSPEDSTLAVAGTQAVVIKKNKPRGCKPSLQDCDKGTTKSQTDSKTLLKKKPLQVLVPYWPMDFDPLIRWPCTKAWDLQPHGWLYHPLTPARRPHPRIGKREWRWQHRTIHIGLQQNSPRGELESQRVGEEGNRRGVR